MYSFVTIVIYLIMVANVATGRHPSNFRTPSRKWITELFADAQRNFSMELAPSEKCRSDYRLYLAHLRNQSVWAVRMRESSEWPSVGVYSGMVDHMGNYAECLRAAGPEGITGKFCMARMEIKNFPVSHLDPTMYLSEGCDCEQCSAWSILQKCADDPVRARRQSIQWAICLPSSCSAEDLQTSLNQLLIPIFDRSDMEVEIKEDSNMCSSNTPVQEYSRGYYLSRFIFLSLIILTIAATVHDLFVRNNEKTDGGPRIILRCFSLRNSYQSLVETSEESKNPLYFLKSILMFIVVIAHRWIFSLCFPLFQTEELEMDYHSGGMFLTTQMNAIDVFLLISGLLLYHFSVNPMRRLGFPYVGIYLVFRIMKTVPVQGLMILFVANILPHLGDGPLWKSTMNWMSEPCKSRWLYNLLAMNNMVTGNNMCLIPTWYLAADFHASLVGIGLLFVLIKNKKLGIYAIAFMFFASSIITSLVAYALRLSGFFVMGIASTRHPTIRAEFHLFYYSSYPRLSSFLLGMILGMVIEHLKQKNYKPPNVLSWILFLTSLVAAILVQYHGFELIYDKHYSELWKAIFAGFYRPVYILPYATLIGIYFVSGVGILDFLFTRRIFFVLGKMGMSILLCSYVFQVSHMSIQRSTMPTSNKLNIYMWSIADIVISLILGFFYYLIIDAPFTNLFKLIRGYIMRQLFATKVDKVK